MTTVSYKRTHVPGSYLLLEDGVAIGIISRRRGAWTASTTSRPHVSVPACATRHEAAMALLGKLAELGG